MPRQRKAKTKSGEQRRKRGRPAGRSPTQWREPGWPKGLYAKQTTTGETAFFFERTWRGERHYEWLKGMSIEQASSTVQQFNYSLTMGLPLPRRHDGKSHTWSAFLRDTMDWVEQHSEFRDNTKTKYSGVIRRLTEFIHAEGLQIRGLSDFNMKVAVAFIAWRERTPVARNGRASAPSKRRPARRTVYDDVDFLRLAFERARERRWIAENPFAEVKKPRGMGTKDSKGTRVTDDELDRLLDAARKFDAQPEPAGRASGFRGMMHDSILLMAETGLRTGEVTTLPWMHFVDDGPKQSVLKVETFRVDYLARPSISPQRAEALRALAHARRQRTRLFTDEIEATKFLGSSLTSRFRDAIVDLRSTDIPEEGSTLTLPSTFEWQPKGAKGEVPLSEVAHQILTIRRSSSEESEPFVFPHPHGGPLRSDYAQRFDQIRTESGVRSTIRAHDLRHTFGQRLRDLFVDLDAIRGLMRHKKMTDTALYAPYGQIHGRDAINRLSEASRHHLGG